MSKPLVTFFMPAYNTEKYIEKAIDSVLNQSEKNFEFFIRNNGSTDKTGEICRYYAEKDKRIILLENKVNNVMDNNEPWCPKRDGEYFAIIDSDDYLEPNFVEIMYKIAKEHAADIVVGGTFMFNDGFEHHKVGRIPPKCVITQEHSVSGELFEKLYGSLRPLWGKLFRTKFYEENYSCSIECPRWIKNGRDTFAVLSYIQKARIIVGVDKALHNYRVREGSTYNDQRLEVSRIKEGDALFYKGKECINYFKIINERTMKFLYNIHFEHMQDLVQLVTKSEAMSIEEKIIFFQEILQSEIFCLYAEKDYNFEYVLQYIVKHIKLILKDVEKLEYARLGKFYIIRLVQALDEKENSEFAIIKLLSVICDVYNKKLWGKKILDKQMFVTPVYLEHLLAVEESGRDIILENPQYLRSFINGIKKKIYNIEKEQLLNAIDNKDYQQASDLIHYILSEKSLDREALYFKIYLLYTEGDILGAIDLVNVVNVFYNDDDELVTLCTQVLKNYKHKTSPHKE